MAAFLSRVCVFAKFNSRFAFENSRKHASAYKQLTKFLRKRKPDMVRRPGPVIYGIADKIAARGYLRPQKEYIPPGDVNEILNGIFSALQIRADPEFVITDSSLRFNILNECFKSFQHGVPNSLLHTINKIGDVIEFYNTPVDTATPMDRYQKMDLPPNLHIQFEYKRFDPEDDQMFGGVSAFPKSGTIVSDLKARKVFKSTKPQNWTKDWRELGAGYIKWH